MIWAVGFAVLGALAYGVGSVLQARAATRSTGPRVLAQPLYVVGIGCDVLAWAASLVAVRHLPLFAVQSVLAGSIGVTVLLAAPVLGTRIRRSDVVAVAGVVAALGVLALGSGLQSALQPPQGFGLGVVVALIVTMVLVWAGYRRAHHRWLAALAGASFAGAAVAARGMDLSGGWIAVLLQPAAWTLIGFGVVGSLAYARSLERGTASGSTAIVWVTEVGIAGLVGIVVLGDTVRSGWQLPVAAAFLAAMAGCALLGRSVPTQAETRTAVPATIAAG